MYRRILVPIDGSATARRGLDEAIDLARSCNASIRVLNVIDEPMMTLDIDGVVKDSLHGRVCDLVLRVAPVPVLLVRGTDAA